MDQQDLKLLTDWFDQNQDHKLNFIEKEAIKLAVKKSLYSRRSAEDRA
jgi:hypothetical protein